MKISEIKLKDTITATNPNGVVYVVIVDKITDGYISGVYRVETYEDGTKPTYDNWIRSGLFWDTCKFERYTGAIGMGPETRELINKVHLMPIHNPNSADAIRCPFCLNSVVVEGYATPASYAEGKIEGLSHDGDCPLLLANS